jgi:soluble lytic murein transglycosylase-like protein
VRGVRAAALALLVLAHPLAAASQPASAILLYAAALRWFNPALDEPAAASLAQATIAAADRERLDARLLVALIAVESRWDPRAVSPAGAAGLGQLMPQTAAALGVDPLDAAQSIDGAARHLRLLLHTFRGRSRPSRFALALAAYNAGLGAVERYGGIPPYTQTRAYVQRVLRLWRRLSGNQPLQAARPPAPSPQ